MALPTKLYTASTLLHNWQEDRRASELATSPSKLAAPSAAERRRAYQTSASDHYCQPSRHAHKFVEPKPRFGMVCTDTFHEALFAYGDVSSLTGVTFDAPIQAHRTVDEVARFESTQRADFVDHGPGNIQAAGQRTVFDKLADKSAFMPAAGGPGAPAPRRERQAGTALVGDKWREGADPKHNTLIQRSWLPGGDPGIAALKNPSQRSTPWTAGASTIQLTGVASGKVAAPPGEARGSETAAWQAPRRVTRITHTQKARELRAGARVFADDL